MTGEEFAAKVEWEGGVLDALEYGLKIDDIDKGEVVLREKWLAAQTAWTDMRRAARAVQEHFNEKGWS